MRYSSRWVSIKSEQAEYAKRIREAERQYAYEKAIVSSVPVSVIGAVSVDIPMTDRREPG